MLDPIDPIPGDYAIVELFGHTTLVGRITETEKFGAKFLAIEVLFAGALLPPVLHGGASIYRLTQCSFAVAWAQQPMRSWSLPAPIRAIVPPLMLEKEEAPTVRHMADVFDDVEDEIPL